MKKPIKITCKNAIEYTNKIFVNEDDLNRPSNAENYVRQEMNSFRNRKMNKDMDHIVQNIK